MEETGSRVDEINGKNSEVAIVRMVVIVGAPSLKHARQPS